MPTYVLLPPIILYKGCAAYSEHASWQGAARLMKEKAYRNDRRIWRRWRRRALSIATIMISIINHHYKLPISFIARNR